MLCEFNVVQVKKKSLALPNMYSMISHIRAGSLHLQKSPEDCLIFPKEKSRKVSIQC